MTWMPTHVLMTTMIAWSLIAVPAQAQEGVEVLISGTSVRGDDNMVLVELRFLNAAAAERRVILPDRIEARGGQGESLWLERDTQASTTLLIAPGDFARARYRLDRAPILPGLTLSIPAWHTQQVVIALPPVEPAKHSETRLAEASSPAVIPAAAPSSAEQDTGNAFAGNLSAYQPIYAVYGPGTNSDGRLQISFKYRLFGSGSADTMSRSWRQGLHFAYTQRMFWDLGARSSPFRNIDFQPELIYTLPSATGGNGGALGGQIGLRHESNGRDGLGSRSINSLYVAPIVTMPLHGRYRLTAAPQINVYIGDKSDNPDIARYRGHMGLFLEIGDDEGWRLSTTSRFNFGSGKGAIAADLSYPLPRWLGGGPDFYLFVQSFHGYGENLLDYDSRTTRLRVGVALVR